MTTNIIGTDALSITYLSPNPDLDFVDFVVENRDRQFVRHVFLTVLPAWFESLGVTTYPETTYEQSLADFRESAAAAFSARHDEYNAAKKPWGRALNELYALEAAKQRNEERIEAKTREVDRLRAPLRAAEAALSDARVVDESARMLDAAWTGALEGRTEEFRWLMLSLVRVSHSRPQLRPLLGILRRLVGA